MSLSANEYVLPTTSERSHPLGKNDNFVRYVTVSQVMLILTGNGDDLVSHYFSSNKKKYGLLYFLNYVKETVWTSPRKQF